MIRFFFFFAVLLDMLYSSHLLLAQVMDEPTSKEALGKAEVGAELMEQIRTGRYGVASISLGRPEAWLERSIQVKFLNEITTKGEAINLLLEGTGYRLLDSSIDQRLTKFLQQEIPDHQRNLVVTRYDVLLRNIAGKYWDLEVDHVNQLISFALMQPKQAHLDLDNPAATADKVHVSNPSFVFEVNAGSLKENLHRLSTKFGWKYFDTNDSFDWKFKARWKLEANTFSDAVKQLTAPWQLTVKFFQADRTIEVDFPQFSSP